MRMPDHFLEIHQQRVAGSKIAAFENLELASVRCRTAELQRNGAGCPVKRETAISAMPASTQADFWKS